jgi:hypothetical protein
MDNFAIHEAARVAHDAVPFVGPPSHTVSVLEAAVDTHPLARQALRHLAMHHYPTVVLQTYTVERLLARAFADPLDNCVWALQVRQCNLFPHMRFAVLHHVAQWGLFDVLAGHAQPAHRGMDHIYRNAAHRALDAEEAPQANVLLRLCAHHMPPVRLDADLLFGALHVLDRECVLDYLEEAGCTMHVGLLHFLFDQQHYSLSGSMFFPVLREPAFADMVRALLPERSLPRACYLAVRPEEVPAKPFEQLCHMFDDTPLYQGLHYAWQLEAVRRCPVGWFEARGGDMEQWHVSAEATLYYISRKRQLPPAGPHLRTALERVHAAYTPELASIGMSVTHALLRLRAQDSRGQRLSCREGMAALPVPEAVQACIAAYV